MLLNNPYLPVVSPYIYFLTIYQTPEDQTLFTGLVNSPKFIALCENAA